MRFGNVWNMNLTWSTSSLGLDHFDVYAYIIVVASKSYALEMCVWKKQPFITSFGKSTINIMASLMAI